MKQNLKSKMEELLTAEVSIKNGEIWVAKTDWDSDPYFPQRRWLKWGTQAQAKEAIKKTQRYYADAQNATFGTTRIIRAESEKIALQKARKYFAYYGTDLKISIKQRTTQ